MKWDLGQQLGKCCYNPIETPWRNFNTQRQIIIWEHNLEQSLGEDFGCFFLRKWKYAIMLRITELWR